MYTLWPGRAAYPGDHQAEHGQEGQRGEAAHSDDGPWYGNWLGTPFVCSAVGSLWKVYKFALLMWAILCGLFCVNPTSLVCTSPSAPVVGGW